MPQQYDPNENVTLSFTAPAALWNRFVAYWHKLAYEDSALFIGQFIQQTHPEALQGNGVEAVPAPPRGRRGAAGEAPVGPDA